MRLDLLSLTLSPCFVVWALFGFTLDAWLSGCTLFFLHSAFFARNDFVDHLKGVDRLNENGGSRVIQRGWLKATSVRNLYRTFLAVGVLLAVPVLLHHLSILSIALFGGLFGLFGYSHLRWSRSGWFVGGLSLFMCLGPLLCFGAFEVSAQTSNTSFLVLGLLGALFGLVAVIFVETRHLISIFIDDQAALQTLPVRFGFDRAKNILSLFYYLVAAILTFTLYCLYHFVGLAIALPIMIIIIQRAIAMRTVSSPLSSRLANLLTSANYLHLALGVLFLALCRI
jgi:1,4-dihydroxy-2-naphthoate octaprenyltransferase